MKKINWLAFANEHGLSSAEFEEQIVMCAAMCGAIRIDRDTNLSGVSFTTNDDQSKLVVTIERVSDNGQ